MTSSSPAAARPSETTLVFAEALADVRRAVDRELAAWIAGKRAAAAEVAPAAAELVDEVARLVAGGGKRLRPALVLLTYRAHRAGRGRGEDAAMRLALATELLHTYLLIHDDIMDHAATRRALPTAHAELAARHRGRGWTGDAEDFGRSAAILAGDLAHTWAVELSRARPGAGVGDADAVGRAFDAMCEEVIAGQYLEMTLPHAAEPAEEDLLRALRLKSGRYSVERPIELGARLAGASEAELEPLGRYGRAVGEAFQLQDDVLGTFGDAGAVGKPVAGDLAEGKLTFLIFHALRLAPAGDAAWLRAALGRPDLTPAEVTRAREILRGSGALAAVLAMIAERLQAARRAIAELDGAGPLDPAGRELFLGFVDYLEERDR